MDGRCWFVFSPKNSTEGIDNQNTGSLGPQLFFFRKILNCSWFSSEKNATARTTRSRVTSTGLQQTGEEGLDMFRLFFKERRVQFYETLDDLTEALCGICYYSNFTVNIESNVCTVEIQLTLVKVPRHFAPEQSLSIGSMPS